MENNSAKNRDIADAIAEALAHNELCEVLGGGFALSTKFRRFSNPEGPVTLLVELWFGNTCLSNTYISITDECPINEDYIEELL